MEAEREVSTEAGRALADTYGLPFFETRFHHNLSFGLTELVVKPGKMWMNRSLPLRRKLSSDVRCLLWKRRNAVYWERNLDSSQNFDKSKLSPKSEM